MSRRTKYFITGGAGFIGSHLVDRLVSEGNVVTVYDNLVSGKKELIKNHFGKENFQFLQADLLDSDALKGAMKGYDIVWHLGANTDIPKGNKITDLDLKNCIIATYNTLEAMRHNGIDKLLFPSSATVYGEIPIMPTPEVAGPLLPISLYGSGKLACEGYISAYCHLFGINAWIFRFANVVGGRMGHGVIYDFIHKLKRNPAELEILGDGNQEKPYFLIEDCLDGMFCAFSKTHKQYDVFNLGCTSTVTVTQIAQIVTEEMGLKNVKFKYTGGKRGWPGDVPQIRFNVDKMAGLGWKASHTSAGAIREAARRLIKELA